MKVRLEVWYQGYNKLLDEQIETAIESLGGEWTDSGAGFFTRDLGFDIPEKSIDAAKKVLDGMKVRYEVKIK